MTEKKELSQLAKTILSGAGHITTFTQAEFDEALAVAKAEIMVVAVETTKTALLIEREACADILIEEMKKSQRSPKNLQKEPQSEVWFDVIENEDRPQTPDDWSEQELSDDPDDPGTNTPTP